ncbi:LytTR family DNA-binding domain-containing protein [Amycolatopsis rubida]|uniref:LytTr DNA-binding domain-containing protein n=1 Tax=Amycolatopsis rubida TaxID=112413 RepID=A0A1I6B3N3_9PSEU|nr:LytTR family DNA-binding domain-containing protein [Amycolatopsis rubida]SFQ75506.1 LytTr DNA-binding domain-containing protein [Amycolatopsis rubida]
MHELDSDLNPLLLVRPRLLMLCGLSDGEWRGATELARLADVPISTIAMHARTLKDVGFLSTNVKYIRAHNLTDLYVRITAPGNEAMCEHIAALERLLGAATSLTIDIRQAKSYYVFKVHKSDGSAIFIGRKQIIYAEAFENTTRVVTPDGTHVMPGRVSLATLQALYPDLIRVHRRYIVAVDAIRGLYQNSDKTHRLETDMGPVPVSRRGVAVAREALARDRS